MGYPIELIHGVNIANGPVGPAMAGPIIEPVIFNFYFFLFNFFSGQINNRASHFDFCNFLLQIRHKRFLGVSVH